MIMVCGFMHCGDETLLVRKLKPRWQCGLLNGVGGKVEKDEWVSLAMVREFEEETKVITKEKDWRLFATEYEPAVGGFESATVYFYVTERQNVPAVPDVNDVGEKLAWWSTRELQLSDRVIGNLRWLLPLSRDWRGVYANVGAKKHISQRPSW